MTEVEILAKLKDIHLPTLISWWPPAPGWFLLFGLFLCLISFCVYAFYLRQKQARPKKIALQHLMEYQKAYADKPNAALMSAQISILLKRVALSYFPREKVAALYGSAWLEFLNETAKGVDFNSLRALLLDLPFQAEAQVDLQPLFHGATLWIKQRRRQCSI